MTTIIPTLGEYLKAKSFYQIDPTLNNRSDIYGIEVEVESLEPLKEIRTEHWITKGDGSLRYYGYEFVSPSVVEEKNIEAAISFLFKRLNKENSVIKDSPRTSIHVHKNMLSRTLVQIWTIITVYWLLESTLFKMCGPFRQGNLFCLRGNDAKGIINIAIRDIKKAPLSCLYNNDSIRYAGLNLTALPKFGTIEFRGMAGLYEEKRFYNWIDIIKRLEENSINLFSSPSDVMKKLHEWGAYRFAQLILDKHVESTFKSVNIPREIMDSSLTVVPFAYCTKWDEYNAFVLSQMNAKGKQLGMSIAEFETLVPQERNNNNRLRPRNNNLADLTAQWMIRQNENPEQGENNNED